MLEQNCLALDLDQAGLPALTTVIKQGPANTGWHNAGGFRAKTGPTRSGLKTDPEVDQAEFSTLAIDVRQCPAIQQGIPAAEGRALPLTFHPGPGH